MKKRNITGKIGIILLITGAFFINSTLLLADSRIPAVAPDKLVTFPAETVTNKANDPKAIKRLRFLQSIRDEIRSTQKDFQVASRTVDDTGKRLEEVQQKVSTLKEQTDNLDSLISQTEAMILNVKMQIGEKENRLLLLYDEMEVKKAALENQKTMLLEYLQTLYEQESSLTDTTGSNEEINITKLLLSDQSVGDQLQQLKYFKILEESGNEVFRRLENLLDDLNADELTIQDQKDRLAGLYVQLGEEKKTQEIQHTAKAHLLEETQGEEKIYQRLMEESLQQQEQVQTDLATLEDNLTFIKQKIVELGNDFNPEDYFSLLSPEASKIYDYIDATRNEGDPTFHWPVSPSRGITAYFHDSSYRAVFGFTHNAVDIRAPQGSLVRAPADGVVYKVRDNGYGYSYLIVAHSGGYMTVYGHISEFKVEEGEKVFSGQVLGYSGGTPGTKGAGLVTTGAHLHFEMMKGGKYIDPLFYLPLTYLPMDSLPEKYKSYVTGDKPKVRRATGDESQSTQEGDLTQMIERNAVVEELTKKALQEQAVSN